MQPHAYGAHEVMELHEVLNEAVNAINTAQLYAPYVRDPELSHLLGHQLQFMQNEYNSMVHTVHGLGAGEALPYRPASAIAAAHAVMGTMQSGQMPQMYPQTYPQTQQPNVHPNQMDDRDVSSAMLGLHKSGATCKMAAALEAAHPQLRNMLLQSAVNCANQAYEMWGYMQRKGYYPFLTMQPTANAQLLRGYQPASEGSQGAGQQMTPPPAAMPSPHNGTVITNAVEPEGPASQQTSAISGVSYPSPTLQRPANASQIFSSPTYRQEHYGVSEETQVAADAEGTLTAEAYSSLSQPTDNRQGRSRKKGASDSTIG
ncbi:MULTISPECIES: spore coat protein [Brevibacillus]|jgi:spore coat protein CotF|uniref:spore coat protein n=1 Tax=Brevibacillus sp. FSL K6-2834 TaxID=2954680 RepID=UPI00315858FB